MNAKPIKGGKMTEAGLKYDHVTNRAAWMKLINRDPDDAGTSQERRRGFGID